MNDEERQQNIARRAERILEIAASMAASISTQVENRIEEIEFHYDGYAEPGYDDGDSKLVATGNWNVIDSYDWQTKQNTHVSDLPRRIANLFEKMGIECEWSDEWTTCSRCGKLVRTQPDSYGWTPSYFFSEYSCDIACIDCLLEDPEDFLSEIEDNENVANTMDEINPSNHGYIRINEDSYESGWYPGQHDSPEEIAKELRKKGISRFLFNIDSVGQFDSHWSVYVHSSEEHLLDPCACGCDDCADSDDCDDCDCADDDDSDCCAVSITEPVQVVVNKNDHPCKCCGTGLNAGETPCWKCGANNPTEV